MTTKTKQTVRQKADATVRRKLLARGYCVHYPPFNEWWACDAQGIVGRGQPLYAPTCAVLVTAGELEPVTGAIEHLYRYVEKAVKA